MSSGENFFDAGVFVQVDEDSAQAYFQECGHTFNTKIMLNLWGYGIRFEMNIEKSIDDSIPIVVGRCFWCMAKDIIKKSTRCFTCGVGISPHDSPVTSILSFIKCIECTNYSYNGYWDTNGFRRLDPKS
jgi:hypothetical protein